MKVKLGGTPFDGEYELDNRYTMRERQTLRDISGLHGFEIYSAIVDDHPGLSVGFAVIAIQRKEGRRLRTEEVEAIWDAPAASIELVFEAEQEEDAGPPVQAEPSASESSENGSAKNGSSGKSSRSVLGTQDEILTPTGQHG